MTAPYDHEALWLKAKLFLNRAMDDDGRSFEEQALWASLALELLAKAALARVSPLLIAEPSEDGTNLLIASGLVEGEARFITVKAKTLYARCQSAFRPFSSSEALLITASRNEYLHGADPGFTQLPASPWWSRYWPLATVLVTAQERHLEELVGMDRLGAVEAYLAQSKEHIKHQTEMLIERAAQRLQQFKAGTLPARIAAQWSPGRLSGTAGMSFSENERCPACGDTGGLLEGEDIADTDFQVEQTGPDEYDTWVDVTVHSDWFSCDNCGLVLTQAALIEEAGRPSTFVTQESDASMFYEPEYGND